MQDWLGKLENRGYAGAKLALGELLEQEIRAAVGLGARARIDPRERLIDLGLDSLRAVEVKAVVEKQLLCSLRDTLLFDHPTLESLTEYLVTRTLGLSPEPTASSETALDEGPEPTIDERLEPEQLRHLLRRATRKLDSFERAAHEPIAIVGMGCRFPGGVNSVDDLWQLLVEERSGITEIPASRWAIDDYYCSEMGVPGTMYARHGGFVDDMDRFDPAFFNISPREAEQLDPQQRILMEVAWETFEHANLPPSEAFGSRTGVFVGTRGSEYLTAAIGRNALRMDAHVGTGNSSSAVAGRLSFFFGFRGPSMAVDTACSSSLVAIHLACQAIRSGQCTSALAGGVNLLLDPLTYVGLCQARMLAPDGECKAFDAAANGYVRAEGCALLLLEPLSVALRKGHRIHALIRGTAVNQDGASGGLTVPNGPAQQAVIHQALTDAAISPHQVAYIESHGTGTALGDPIEIGALQEVFGASRFHGLPLFVGTVKANIGHAETSAGVAGVMKTVLALQHELMVPQRNFRTPNPRIPWDDAIFRVVAEPTPWERGETERVAGVSSFGFTGTNAHIVMSEAPHDDRPASGSVARTLLPVSAKTSDGLAAALRRQAAHLATTSDPLVDVAWSLSTGRDHFPHREVVVADSVDTAVAELERAAKAIEDASERALPKRVDGIAFAFTGQGSVRHGMGRELYERFEAFRQALDACDAHMRGDLDLSLPSLLWGPQPSRLHEARYAQPALFAYQYASSSLWRSFGIEPRCVIGHSLGEIAAACVAGVFDLGDAARLVLARGRSMDELASPGSMLQVSLPEARAIEVLHRVAPAAVIAVVNGPTDVVIAGTKAEIEALHGHWQAEGVRTRELTVSHGFHSPGMDPMLDAFRRAIASVRFGAPVLDFVSSRLGARVTDELAGPDYWVAQVREAVRYREAVEALAAESIDVVLEIGPNPTLTAMGRRDAGERLAWLASARPPRAEDEQLDATLAELYRLGAPVRWSGAHADRRGRSVVLPSYPFAKDRIWTRASSQVLEGAVRPELLGSRVDICGVTDVIAHQALLDREHPVVTGHRVMDQVVFPATGYMQAAIAATESTAPIEIVDLEIAAPLLLDADARCVQFVSRNDGERLQFAVASRAVDASSGDWLAHMRASVGPASGVDQDDRPGFEALRSRFCDAVDIEALYGDLTQLGLDYGPTFRNVIGAWREPARTDEAWLQVRASAPLARATADWQAVGLLDACFHGALAGIGSVDALLLPVGAQRLLVHARDLETMEYAHVRVERSDSDVLLHVAVFDGTGRRLLDVDGLRLHEIDTRSRADRNGPAEPIYDLDWIEARLPEASTSASEPVLVVGGRAGVGEQVCNALQRRGAIAVHLDLADLEPTLRELPRAPAAVIGLFALEADAAWSQPIASDPTDAAVALTDVVARTMQACIRANSTARVWALTRNAQRVLADDDADPRQSTIWGLQAIAEAEYPVAQWSVVDLDTIDPDELARCLAEEIAAGTAETRIAYRGGRRFVERLSRVGADRGGDVLARPELGDVRLSVEAYGSFANLTLAPIVTLPPGPGQVRVALDASALNFKDVLFALGTLESFAQARGFTPQTLPLGFEGCGRVVELGSDVDPAWMGRRVIVTAEGCLASSINVPLTQLVVCPDALSSPEAAGLPTAFMTAIHALEDLADIQAGDTVLVHAAAGGVGLAALQIVRARGARVIATASRNKWETLRELGIDTIFNSREPDFAEALLRATDMRGVDVVLNSLGTKMAEESLRALAVGGRFVELGKVDILTADEVRRRRPDVAYHQFDLSDVFAEHPERQVDLLQRMVARIERGELRAIRTKVFPITHAPAAFRHLAGGQNIGKVALAFTENEHDAERALVRTDGTYVVTGGLGALGLEVAGWLLERGAGALVLVGRRPPTDAAMERIATWIAAGHRVEIHPCDVADATAVRQLFASLESSQPPLRGIVHAAGILHDRLFERLDRADFERLFEAKARGAWNLHEATRDRELDWLVLFSSGACVVGTEGQAAYAAANAFLSEFAGWRRKRGFVATAVDWGLWASVGMGEQANEQLKHRRAERGQATIEVDAALACLERVLRAGATRSVIAQMDWGRYAKRSTVTPFLERVIGGGSAASLGRGRLRETLMQSRPEDRPEVLLRALVAEIAVVSGHGDPSDVDIDRDFASLGMDSLLALDLRTGLEKQLGCAIPPTLFAEYPTPRAFSKYLIDRLFGEKNA